MRRLVTALMVGFGACRSVPKAEYSGDLSGSPLPAVLPRPAFKLLTTSGDTFDFSTRTRGRLTLLFFGYTHCPDVCPATMQNIAAVTGRLTSEDRRRAVTTLHPGSPPERGA